jgi:hypothetical protein
LENLRGAAYQDNALAVTELEKQEQRESMGPASSHRPSAKNNKTFVKSSRVDGFCLVTRYCPTCCSKMTMMTPQLVLDHLKNLACMGCSFLLERFDSTRLTTPYITGVILKGFSTAEQDVLISWFQFNVFHHRGIYSRSVLYIH